MIDCIGTDGPSPESHMKTPLLIVCFQQSMIMSLLAQRLEVHPEDSAKVVEYLYLSSGWVKDMEL